MSGASSKATLFVFTIGHSNQSLEGFLGLLKQSSIEVLVDVRSAPHSTYVPHFNRESLEPAVTDVGIDYAFMGKELGGKRETPMPFSRIAVLPEFRAGIERLVGMARRRRLAVMCGEEDPAHCHRRNLIGPALAASGVSLLHIRGDGRIQTEEELQRESTGGQETFEFGEPA
ncbi:MAG: DUF488 domain-containing protein [candidate division WOR-3 bacterium]|nr:MAG: DUF488 domain-containing protein [candidate division WOR-3 bacterium]